MNRKTIVIKIGGNAATNEDSLIELIKEIGILRPAIQPVLVHGGGAEVSKISKTFGYEPEFVHGLRVTRPGEMDIVEMVLAGKMNKYLVRVFGHNGIPAVGLCGSDGHLFTGKPVETAGTRTGAVFRCDPRLIEMLLHNEYLPVIASTSVADDGLALNINADEAALAVAAALKAESLIFISDIPGILRNQEVLAELKEPESEMEISKGTISGGMIPKVRSSIEGLKKGIAEIVIGDYSAHGDLQGLVGHNRGTRIIL